MTTEAILRYLEREIHTVVMATAGKNGELFTCAIDIMDSDESGLFFLTARGKGLYHRLKEREAVALTGIRGGSTLSCAAVSVQGMARELGGGPLPRLFERNPYMNEIYPTAESRRALTVFQIYRGSGEWFDLSRKPIERQAFVFGGAEQKIQEYRITERCNGCRACESVCPQGCIYFINGLAEIQQNHCLRCGNCMEVCPRAAVIRQE